MELSRFTFDEKKLFESYLGRVSHVLAAYCFVNVFVWRCLYDIRWCESGGKFCLFYQDRAGGFMPLPPLGQKPEASFLNSCFDVMASMGSNPQMARIENIEEKDIRYFEQCGFSVYEKSCDYIVRREAIASLKGQRLKHRRNLYNFFTKNTKAVFRDYQVSDRVAVEALWGRWKASRLASGRDRFYSGMLEDNGRAFQELLEKKVISSCVAKVVTVDDKVVAFTSGARVSEDVFCVNYELADPSFKGLSQFVFTELAKSIPHAQINMMDDAGIASLKEAKLLLGDVERVPSWTAVRRDRG
jgi:uncharacterized protein